MRHNPVDSLRRTSFVKARGLLIGWPGLLLTLTACAIGQPLGSRATDAGSSGVQTPVQTSAPSQQSTSAAASTQEPALTLANFEYEVSSFKPNKSSDASSSWSDGGDALTAANMPLQSLIEAAFGIRDAQLIGAPAWLNSERYDINAKMSGETATALKSLSVDERNRASRGMMQKLFAERLKLTTRHDTKEMPVYFLLIAKNGSKLAEAKPDEKSTTNTNGGGGEVKMSARAMTMDGLATRLSGRVGRIVLNKTYLTGKFDFMLNWAEDRPVQPSSADAAVPVAADPTGPSIFTALQEQLGLKLESGKGPVEIIVIEHVERPSGN